MKPLAALLLALSASSCAPRAHLDQPLPPAPPELSSEPEPAAPGASGLDDLLRRVAAVRGLEPGPTPALLELPAAQLAREARAQLERDMPESVRRAQAHLLWRLGLVPRDFELGAALERALPGRLEAFYAAEPPALYVDRALSPAARQRALAHELVHALQDHRHALARRLRYEPGSWDRQSALHALAEADALAVVEQLGGSAAADNAGPDAPASLPGVIARSLAAPYIDARPYVGALLERGGFRAVDGELAQPPASTHALLHPGAAALPALAEFPAPGPDWRRSYADVLGEQSLRLVLEEWAPPELAARLAADWAADHVSLFERAGQQAIVWELAFARPEAAAAVARLLRTSSDIGARSARAVAGWTCEAKEDGTVVAVYGQGDQVRFGSLPLPPPAGCPELKRWLRGTRVRIASSVARYPARQPSEVGSRHRTDQFWQPPPVENSRPSKSAVWSRKSRPAALLNIHR